MRLLISALVFSSLCFSQPVGQGVLATYMDTSTTTFNLQGGNSFSATSILTIGGEQISCSTANGSGFTGCTRGYASTTATIHGIGSIVTVWGAGAASTATNLAGGTTGQFPYQTGVGATGFKTPNAANGPVVLDGSGNASFPGTVTVGTTLPSGTHSLSVGSNGIAGAMTDFGGQVYNVNAYITPQAAVTAACITGGIVFFPAGLYTGSLSVGCSNITLQGVGPLTVLQSLNSDTVSISLAAGISSVAVTNLTIHPVSGSTSGRGIAIYKPSGTNQNSSLRIEDVSVYGVTDGIYVENTVGMYLKNISIQAGANGINFNGTVAQPVNLVTSSDKLVINNTTNRALLATATSGMHLNNLDLEGNSGSSTVELQNYVQNAEINGKWTEGNTPTTAVINLNAATAGTQFRITIRGFRFTERLSPETTPIILVGANTSSTFITENSFEGGDQQRCVQTVSGANGTTLAFNRSRTDNVNHYLSDGGTSTSYLLDAFPSSVVSQASFLFAFAGQNIVTVSDSSASRDARLRLSNLGSVWDLAGESGSFNLQENSNSNAIYIQVDRTTGYIHLNRDTTEALGYKFACTHGANATCGAVTLTAGTATVSTTAVHTLAAAGAAGYQIHLECQNIGSACGVFYISTLTDGTSFVITSTGLTDSFFWQIGYIN